VRGETDAPLIGNSLKENEIAADLIISSPARRAISTATIIAEKLGYEQKGIVQIKAIYEASCEALINIVNQIDDKNNRVFIFGHNPGFTYLAEKLSGQYIGNLPTCGVVGIQFQLNSWEMVMQNTGTQIY